MTRRKLDGEGNLLWVEEQNGNRTTSSYDLAGRRTEETFADGTTKTYEYDLAGRLPKAPTRPATSSSAPTMPAA